MGLISWIILGALAGWIASIITGRNARMGAVANILVGVAGAGLGGLIASLLGLGTVTGINLGSVLIAVGGACLFLFVTGLFSSRRS